MNSVNNGFDRVYAECLIKTASHFRLLLQ